MKYHSGKHDFMFKKLPLISLLSFIISLSILYSCGTHSVRYIKENQIAEAEAMRPIRVNYKSPKTPLTSELFMINKRMNIEYSTGISSKDELVKTRTLDTLVISRDGRDTVNIQYTVKTPITHFNQTVSERRGKIPADFIINIPKEYLSDFWCITLTPEVRYKDSTLMLKDIVIKGAEFHNKQLDDYKAYDDFLLSILDKSQYDSLFIDHMCIMKDMRDRQNAYWQIYNKDWKLQMEYESWKSNNEQEKMKLAAEKIGKEKSLLQEYTRNSINQAAMDIAAGKDTTGIFNRHMQQYHKEIAKLPGYFNKREQSLEKIPKQFKEIHEAKRSLDDLSNKAITEIDSVQIAKNRYRFDEIAENEIKKKRKDEKFKEIVVFPFREDVLIDSIVDPTKDFTYRYIGAIPVGIDDKYLEINVKGKVNAVDLSTFSFPQTDTLAYNILSLSHLADSTLKYQQIVTKRNEVRKVTAYIDYETNSWTVNPKYGNNKREIAKITDMYRSLNNDNVFDLDSVVLITSSSLDGSYEGNAKISRWRAKSIKEYLKMTLPNNANVDNKCISKFIGEDWNTLLKLVDKRKDLVNKREIIQMMTTTTDPDFTEKEIKKQYPSDYNIMHEYLYPLLRKTDAEFYIHRKGFVEDKVEQQVKNNYEEGLHLLKTRQYEKALTILSAYNDFNTALCYACLEQYGKAYSLLSDLNPTSESELLLAIICYSVGKENVMIKHISRALRLDPEIIDKVKLDDNMIEIIEKYNLK